MLTAFFAATLSVALGVFLALVPAVGSGAIGPVRTFALVSAVIVVTTHLFPEAVQALGFSAIAVFVAALVLPALAEHLIGHEHGHRPSGIALEMIYAGLVLHHIGDGIALYAYGASPAARWDVVLALAGHTVPLIAVVVLQYGTRLGKRAGIVRAMILLAAMMAGMGCADALPREVMEQAGPWIGALVSGLLLHVIVHDLEADTPSSTSSRALDLGAAIVGVALPLSGGLPSDGPMLSGFATRLLACAPSLLLGWAVIALVASRLERISAARSPAGPRSGDFGWGAHGRSMDALLVALRSCGIAFAGAWLVIAMGAGLVSRRLLGPDPRAAAAIQNGNHGFLAHFDRAFRRAAPWIFVGCYVAELISTSVPVSQISAIHSQSLALLLATVVLVPTGMTAAGSMPIAVALISGGASIGAVLSFIVIGSIAALPRLAVGAETHGFRRAFIAGLAVTAFAVAMGALTDFAGAGMGLQPWEIPPSIEIGAAALLAVALFRSIWASGVRGFIAGAAR